MAFLNLQQAVDMRNMPDPFSYNVSMTTLSTSYSIKAQNIEFRVDSDYKPLWLEPSSKAGQSKLVGEATQGWLTVDGKTLFSVKSGHYLWGNDYAREGYVLDGLKIYGLRAEVAAWLSGDDQIFGSFGDDWLEGYDGNDLFWQSQGNDTIDGGAGLDMMRYSGTANSYNAVKNADGTIAVNSTGSGRDTLINIERVDYATSSTAFDLGITENAGQAARLLGVVAGKGALADKAIAGTLIEYVDTYGSQTVAELLVNLGLVADFAGGADNASFFSLLYKNVVGAPPSAAELAELVSYVDSGAFTQAEALQFVAGLDITANQLGIIGMYQMGWDYKELEL